MAAGTTTFVGASPCIVPLQKTCAQKQPGHVLTRTAAWSHACLPIKTTGASWRNIQRPSTAESLNARHVERHAFSGLSLDSRAAPVRSFCRRNVTARNLGKQQRNIDAQKESAAQAFSLAPAKTHVGALPNRSRKLIIAAALKEKEEAAKKDLSENDGEPFWLINEPWDIPWTGKTTAFTMTAWLLGFILTGVAVPLGAIKLGFAPGDDADSKALFVLVYELMQTAVGLTIVYLFTKPFAPLGDQLFKFDLSRPLNRKDGWLLYALVGFVFAFGAVQTAANVMGVGNDPDTPRDAGDALMQLLPIIGESPLGTASLITVTGICAPLLEETVFRGFLLPSLTKWIPTWAAIVISAVGFAAAHVTPGELPQLTALGLVLGLAYAQTRNLACPMLIHSLWNSGVIIVLTVLKVNGVDIKEFV